MFCLFCLIQKYNKLVSKNKLFPIDTMTYYTHHNPAYQLLMVQCLKKCLKNVLFSKKKFRDILGHYDPIKPKICF